jgi:hypothetical protein
MVQAVGGIDNKGQRLKGVGSPTAADDGVPKGFLRYDLSFSCSGKPSAGEVFGPMLIAAACSLPVDMAGTRARARTAPADAAKVWTLKRTPAGSTTATAIGTVTLNTNGTFTLATQAAVTLAVDDFLDLVAPATQDSAMADVGITIVLVR